MDINKSRKPQREVKEILYTIDKTQYLLYYSSLHIVLKEEPFKINSIKLK